MGSADVRAYSRNKRGIAGSLIWINFDRHALLNLFHKARGRFVADTDEIRPQYAQDAPDANAIFSSSIIRNVGVSVSDTIDKLDSQVNDIYGMNELAEPWYADQILPFDITLAGANEYGAMASAKIFGVEILERRGRRRQRRRRTEMQATFVACAMNRCRTRSLRPSQQHEPRAHARKGRRLSPTYPAGTASHRGRPDHCLSAGEQHSYLLSCSSGRPSVLPNKQSPSRVRKDRIDRFLGAVYQFGTERKIFFRNAVFDS